MRPFILKSQRDEWIIEQWLMPLALFFTVEISQRGMTQAFSDLGK